MQFRAGWTILSYTVADRESERRRRPGTRMGGGGFTPKLDHRRRVSRSGRLDTNASFAAAAAGCALSTTTGNCNAGISERGGRAGSIFDESVSGSLPEKARRLTTTASGRMVFGIFATLAEFERDLIRERTMAGLAAARARGRKGGRKFARTKAQMRLAQAAMAQRDPSFSDLCEELGSA